MPKIPENSNGNSKPKRKIPDAVKPFQFKPGQSGNPGGRPKKKPITEIYEEILNDPKIRAMVKQAAIKRLTSDRMVGGLELKEAAERVEGKVTQPVDIELNISLAERMQRARERSRS